MRISTKLGRKDHETDFISTFLYSCGSFIKNLYI